MKAIYNGEILDFEDISLKTEDRGFRYGDGLFESIAVVKSKPRLLQKHYDRLLRGADVFGFNIDLFHFEQLQNECMELIYANNIREYGKMRLSVWRKGKGLYQPPGDGWHHLIIAQALSALREKEIVAVDFCENVTNHPTIYSPFKTMSALKYVLAGLEKETKGLEEIIIRDHHGFVSESLDANIFIKKDNIYITPPISTGCIEGVMRNWLIEKLISKNITVEEGCFKPNEMLEAKSVFTTNALGVKHILKIRSSDFEKDNFIQDLINEIN